MTSRARQLSQTIEQRIGVQKLVAIATLVFFASIAAVYLDDSGGISSDKVLPPVSSSTTSTTVAKRGPGIDGFNAISYTINRPGKDPVKLCGLLAESEEQRNKGMMGQSNFGGYDGMLFKFAEDTTAQFYMANVPVPLSIAWFNAAGEFVSSAEMDVCREADVNNCPLYSSTGPYRIALEALGGGLGALGIEPGASLSIDGPCV